MGLQTSLPPGFLNVKNSSPPTTGTNPAPRRLAQLPRLWQYAPPSVSQLSIADHWDFSKELIGKQNEAYSL